MTPAWTIRALTPGERALAVEVFADDLKLVHGTGTLEIAGHQQGRMPLCLEPSGELSGQRVSGPQKGGGHEKEIGFAGHVKAPAEKVSRGPASRPSSPTWHPTR